MDGWMDRCTYPNRGHGGDILQEHLHQEPPQPTIGMGESSYHQINHVPAPLTSEPGSDGWMDGWTDGWTDGWNGRGTMDA